jgi:L-aspartate oxidase
MTSGTAPFPRESGVPAGTGDLPAEVDVIIVGGGIAGLTVALSLPPAFRVLLATKGTLGESNTRYAQGGLAAAVGLDDSADLHLHDTLAAGAGLVDAHAARALVDNARASVSWLIGVGTRFDGTEPGATTGQRAERPARAGASSPEQDLATRYDLTREAAHSRRRVLHARDATGAEIERALVEAVRRRPLTVVLDSTAALDLVVDAGRCVGVVVARELARTRVRARHAVVLANGGAGRLWLRSTNPAGATADGLALAWRAGAVLADLEFVQFHPTVLALPEEAGEPFLISEAVRGEGALLRNAAGERFMPRYAAEGELAPRDVVARAIHAEMLAADAPCVYLDLRHLPAEETRARFPTIAAVCLRYGLDLARDRIPVAPAAHYFMGGVAVDTWARTTVPGLYAVGEVACTGVHGANRLASNSLLEGLVFGRRAAAAIAEEVEDRATWPGSPVLLGSWLDAGDLGVVALDPALPPAEGVRGAMRHVMWRHVGLHRSADGLRQAAAELRTLEERGPFDPETASMLFAARAITAACLARAESRGGHFRDDFPARDAAQDGRHSILCRSTPSSTTPHDTGRVITHA